MTSSARVGTSITLQTNIYNYRLLLIKLNANRLYSTCVVPSNTSTNLAFGGLYSQQDNVMILVGGTLVITDSGDRLTYNYGCMLTLSESGSISVGNASQIAISEILGLYPQV